MFFDIVFYAFLLTSLIQLAYYLFVFRKFSFSKQSHHSKKNIAVSVIICAKNEARNLKKFLPYIINQDYPNFEIVLVNDASVDDSLDIMENYASKHNNIKIVDVKNNEAFWANKKYALTLGIKAAKNDYLIFTDADCKPVSKHWIQEIACHFSSKKTIVLGYGAYKKVKNSFLNKLIRFETMLTAIQYFSFAELGLPYMGVGRNLAYRKDEFFKVNGFIDHMDVNSGDDDLFINQVANSQNTAVCYSPYSFTKSIPKSKFKEWFQQKRRHISTAKRYKPLHKFLLATFYASQIMFWILAIILFIATYKLYFMAAIFIVTIFVKYLVTGFSAKKLHENDLIPLYPLLEVFLIIFQFSIFITNLISKPNHWK